MRVASTPREQVAAEGYAFLPQFRPDLPSTRALGLLGQIDVVEGIRAVQTLTPHQVSDSTPNTYSGNFGTGEFPLHTDLAHWAIPPRYIALRCVSGSASVGTMLLDGSALVKKVGNSRLRMALVQPRRPFRYGRQLLRLLERTDSAEMERVRWDSIFLKPTNTFAAAVVVEVHDVLVHSRKHQVVLREPGDTLLLDNWRLLHGRTPVSGDGHTRIVDRAYLEMLHS